MKIRFLPDGGVEAEVEFVEQANTEPPDLWQAKDLPLEVICLQGIRRYFYLPRQKPKKLWMKVRAWTAEEELDNDYFLKLTRVSLGVYEYGNPMDPGKTLFLSALWGYLESALFGSMTRSIGVAWDFEER